MVVVTAKVTPMRCDSCNISLYVVRDTTDCREYLDIFLLFLVNIEEREIAFHELEDPTEIIIDQLRGPSDFIISDRLLAFSLGRLNGPDESHI